MEKSDYLQNLERTLKANFSQQQANDILADYTEFFDTGIAEGKSESELCAEFGSPESVARELLESNCANHQWTIPIRFKCVLTITVFLLFLLFPFIAHNSSLFPSAFLFLLPLLIQAIIFTGNISKFGISTDNPSKLYRARQSWLSGWRYYILVLLTSLFFGYYLAYDYIARLPSDGTVWVYSIILIFLGFLFAVRAGYPMQVKTLRGVKIILVLSYIFIAILTSGLVWLVLKESILLMNRYPDGNELMVLISIIANVSVILFTLTIFSGILTTFYSSQKNSNLKWLIFIHTTILCSILNLIQVLSCGIENVQDFARNIFVAIRFAILQNATAAVLFLLFTLVEFIWRKRKVKGEFRYERADEKGDS